MSDRLAGNHRLVVRVVLIQTGCALTAASLFLVFKGASAGFAALAGGVIVAAGSVVFGWRMFAPGIAGAARVTSAMYSAVVLKWLWLGLALYVAFALLKLDAVPLFIGLMTAQLGYWAALIRLK